MKRLVLPFVLIFMGGCTYKYTKAPYPVKHKASTQYELQAVSHWKLIAQDFANSLKNPKEPVYIKMEQNTPFAKNFYELLKVELIKKGFSITNSQYNNPVTLEVKINVVKFKSDRKLNKFPYKLTLLTTGVWVASAIASPYVGAAVATGAIVASEETNYQVLSKFYSNPPKYEINIEGFEIKDNKYIDGISRIYYVADEDALLYQSLPIIKVKGSEDE